MDKQTFYDNMPKPINSSGFPLVDYSNLLYNKWVKSLTSDPSTIYFFSSSGGYIISILYNGSSICPGNPSSANTPCLKFCDSTSCALTSIPDSIANLALLEMTPTSSGANLLNNPGFESGTSIPTNWGFFASGSNIPVLDTTTYHSGLKSVKLYIPGTTNGNSGYLRSDLISSSPGKVYTFSAWGKSTSVNGSYEPAVRLIEYDSAYTWLRQTNIDFPKGTYSWTQLQGTATVGVSTAYIAIGADIYNSYGTFWVDDMYLSDGTTGCTPNWVCRQPLDGYIHDVNNCGQPDKLDSTCNPISCPSNLNVIINIA